MSQDLRVRVSSWVQSLKSRKALFNLLSLARREACPELAEGSLVLGTHLLKKLSSRSTFFALRIAPVF